ncbi:uncharacterized protein ACA1_292760 [Acanthamoeba castellanii str. Neff]|uniref:Uncharacterized protein n=1 Tax=Acanthamoeba castellanii (strain ATCC 30010 / Neff) TaxID=1257118 RepID=L8HJK3_ACACF|nr:uncharacterized protein ACA1_292760 [Acanthamoeba castellanii str. Neff]ELR25385.1 hypothetical protein ACA1_292760 [Acanthamoeba castellanii str. Neff]
MSRQGGRAGTRADFADRVGDRCAPARRRRRHRARRGGVRRQRHRLRHLCLVLARVRPPRAHRRLRARPCLPLRAHFLRTAIRASVPPTIPPALLPQPGGPRERGRALPHVVPARAPLAPARRLPSSPRLTRDGRPAEHVGGARSAGVVRRSTRLRHRTPLCPRQASRQACVCVCGDVQRPACFDAAAVAGMVGLYKKQPVPLAAHFATDEAEAGLADRHDRLIELEDREGVRAIQTYTNTRHCYGGAGEWNVEGKRANGWLHPRGCTHQTPAREG